MASIDVIIPVLNEEPFIKPCLESLLGFEHDSGTAMTVYVVDGGSSDSTKEIVREMAASNPEIRILDNPKRIQSCALNKALGLGIGDYVLRLDAHARYPRDYLVRCLAVSQATNADNVGGIIVTHAGGPGFQAKLVQSLCTHRFGVGNSSFRLNARPGPADTVPFGFFRRGIFQKIGFFDERLVRAQDYEFNRRIIASGGRVWLDPAIRAEYFNLPNLWSFYKKQFLREGCYNAYMWYFAPYAFALRHALTGLFAAGILGGCLGSLFTPLIFWPFAAVITLYFLFASIASVQQACRYRSAALAVALPPCIFVFHFLHGLSVLGGLFKLWTGTSPVQKVTDHGPVQIASALGPRRILGKGTRLSPLLQNK